LRHVGSFRLTGLSRDDGVQTLAVAPGRRAVAAVGTPNHSGAGHLLTGTLPAGSARRQPVPVHRVATPLSVQAVVGWRDPDHVLVRGALHGATGVYAVDARTGTPRRVVAEPTQTWTPGVFYASSLWSSPTARRPGPPSVLDPRLATLAGAGLAGVLLVVVLDRRRRRALG
ncbi:MAG: hypothetical protein HOQ22_11435, partial [Nocardioidaceae bacterium]|nr:hypothetical protein [Nocardioidaceae bacterium]